MRNKIGLSQFYSSKELICPQSDSIFADKKVDLKHITM